MSSVSGSIPTRVTDVIAAVTMDLGHTAALVEIHALYEQRFGSTERKSVSHALALLVERGVVTKHGRNRRLRYCLAHCPVPHTDPADLLPAILEVVREEAYRRQEAVSASEVHARLLEIGHEVSIDQVRTRLETLAHSSDQKRERGTGAWAEAQLERKREQRPGGHGRVYWRPVNSKFPAPERKSKRDLLRAAIRRVGELLGCPATREEISRWARAVPRSDHDAAMADSVLSGRAAQRFSAVSRDALRGTGPVAVTSTDLTCRGVYPARFAWGDPTTKQHHLCVLLDAATLLRPDEEVDALRRLPLMQAYLSQEFLDLVHATRCQALRAAAERFVPGGVDWDGVLQAHDRAVLQLTEWTLKGPENQFKKDTYIGGLRRTAQQLRALRVALDYPVGDRAILHVGQYNGIPLEQLEEVATQVVRLTGSGLSHWRALFEGVRRFGGRWPAA